MFCSVIIPSVALLFINPGAIPNVRISACFPAGRGQPPRPVSSKWLSRSTGPNMSRILIVEDDKDIADLIGHALQKAGHTTEQASSGTAAVPRVKQSAPDLVLLDVMLPGMDG